MPQPGAFLTAEWRWLLMLHHEVAPSALQPLVPPGTELDLHHGQCLVGLVAFRFLDTRLLGLPIPFHRNFEEVNLRFYVKRKAEGKWRRGVVFIRELVPRWAIATVARLAYGEPYSWCRMDSSLVDPASRSDAVGEVRYSWSGKPGSGALSATFSGAPFPLEPGSTEEFVAEHYFGYTPQRDDSTLEYEVEHPPWRAWTAASHSAEGEWDKLYGPAFAEALQAPAISALVAEGSGVTVRRPTRLFA